MAKLSSALILIAAALQQCGQQLADGQVTHHISACDVLPIRCQKRTSATRKTSFAPGLTGSLAHRSQRPVHRSCMKGFPIQRLRTTSSSSRQFNASSCTATRFLDESLNTHSHQSALLLQEVTKLQQQNAALQERALQWESEREKLHDCIDQFRCIHMFSGAVHRCQITRCQQIRTAGWQ